MKFVPDTMDEKFVGNSYKSPAPPKKSHFATAEFYARFFWGPFRWLCYRCSRGECDDYAWCWASNRVADLFEEYSPFEVDGLDYLRNIDEPCVIVANHMSTLETFVLPGMIRPFRPVTFVVKKSLTKMPFFGSVMRSRDPVIVGRKNPREDLARVLEGGEERLRRGISIVIFPQGTRAQQFDRQHFNSIGVKLARHANVPVVPLALLTDAWGQGKKIKDFGKISPGKTVRFKFAPPMRITGSGKDEHRKICDFIDITLAEWRKIDGAENGTI